MTIESSAPLATNVYLTGKVYDTFDGRRWLQSREDTEKERYADTARTLCALAKYEEDYQPVFPYQLFVCSLKIVGTAAERR